MSRQKDRPRRVLNARIDADVYSLAEQACAQKGQSLTNLTETLLRKHLRMTAQAINDQEKWALRALRATRSERGEAQWAAALLGIQAWARKTSASMSKEMQDDLKVRKADTQDRARAGGDN